MNFKEKPARSLLKALTYRCLGTLVTIGVVFKTTGALALSLSAGALDFFSKIILFYSHERIWNWISWGREEHAPCVIWFTGLSGAGKSTLAEKLFEKLKFSHETELLDGDQVRSFFKDLGFSKEERLRHLKSMGWIAAKLESHGTIVIASFITPYEEARFSNRSICKKYIEVHVSTSLEACEKRDIKGLYKKARSGAIQHFTGISDPFETPSKADITIDTDNQTIDESFHYLITQLLEKEPKLKSFLKFD